MHWDHQHSLHTHAGSWALHGVWRWRLTSPCLQPRLSVCPLLPTTKRSVITHTPFEASRRAARVGRARQTMVNIVSPQETKILFTSVLTLVFSIAALGSLIFGADQLTHDLKDLDGLSTLPKPCGIATPYVQDLARWTAMLGSRTLMPVRTSDAASKLQSRICEQPTVTDAIDKFYDGNAGNGSAAALQQHICDKRGASGTYDPLRRLSRAYLRAATAFARVSSGACALETSYPFQNGACTNGQLVRDEMMHAVREPVTKGYAGQLPSTSTMLYRLTALSVLAHYDRENSDNKCFGNIAAPLTTLELCESIYNGISPPSPPPGAPVAPPPPPQMPVHPGSAYAFDVYDSEELLPNCEDPPNASSVTRMSPPPPPPPPSKPVVAFDDDTVPSLSNDVRQCVRQHTFALYDVETLYNMPNFNELPNLDVQSPYAILRFDLLYDGLFRRGLDTWFYGNRRDKVLEHHEREIMIFSSFRVAIGLFWVLWGISTTMWWMAYGGLPAIVILMEIIGRASRNNGEPPENASIERPTFNGGMVLATLTSILYGAWVFLVHPWPTPTVPRLDLECADFKEDGSVYSTTRAAKEAAVVAAGGVVLSSLTALAYTFLLKPPPTGVTRTASELLKLVAIAIALVMIILEAYILNESVDEWVSKVRDVDDMWHTLPEKRIMVENDIRVLVATTAGATAAAAGLNQRYVFNNRGKGWRSLYALAVAAVIWIGRTTKASIHGQRMYAEVDGVYTSGNRQAFDTGVYAAEIALSVVTVIVMLNLWTLPQKKSKAKKAKEQLANRFSWSRRNRVSPMQSALDGHTWEHVDPAAPPSNGASDDEKTPFVPSLAWLGR